MLDRFLLVVLADEHAGSNLALCNPNTVINRSVPVVGEDGSVHMDIEEIPVEYNPILEMVWDKYLEGIEKFIKIADGDPIFILKLGEVCEGTYYANSSMNLHKDEQVQMAVWNMKPWLGVENVKMIRICTGDRPHEFDEGAAAKIVAGRLKNFFPDVRAVNHGLLDIGGFKIDYAHKGPAPGSRKWLEGNVARYYLTDYMMREQIEFGRKPADLVLRAHYHEPVEERRSLRYRDGMIRSGLLIAPCLKFPDAYAKTVTGNRFSAAIGTTAVEVVKGKLHDFHDNFTVVDTRTWEVYDG